MTEAAMAPGVSFQEFRDAFSAVPTPVSVVTAVKDGKAHGTTVSAFCSLSADPPLVMLGLERSSDLLKLIRETRRFGVNVLSTGQEQIALACARKGPDKFAAIPWHYADDLPRLDDGASWLACRLEAELPGGDHVIVVGLITACEASTRTPLVYLRRQFQRPVSETQPSPDGRARSEEP
jgi:flavin reductase (DIM6/NTAB) family NADH-FMN oxidoreductase RutF